MSPARSGVSPSPPCRCRASAKKNPPNTAMVTNRAATPIVTPGRRSTRPGIRGDPPRAATRRSTTANSPNSSALPARQIQPQTGQCSGWPRTSGRTRATAAGVSRASPAGSRPRPRSPAPCGSSRAPATSRATPIGTLTQEHGPPAAAEQVRGDQQAAGDLPGDRAAGDDRGVQPHRAGPRRPGERALDQAEHLRDHGRGAGPLDKPQRDQHAGGGGQAAAERGQGEQGQPGQEHPAVPDDVAEPGAGDQQHRVGDDVAGDDELQPGAGGVQARRGWRGPRR